MTIALTLMLAATQVAAAPEPPLVVPTDWSALPPAPWRSEPAITLELVRFVEDEVRAGRCATPRTALDVELALLVRSDGLIRQVVPRAIGCPSVEQFAAGLVTSFARNNLRQPAAGWYRATITFALGK